LVLNGAKEDRVGEVHHLGDAAARGSKEDTLRFGWTVDDVFGRAEVFADELGLVLVEGALKVAGEEAIHDVHAGCKGEFGDAANVEGVRGECAGADFEDHGGALAGSMVVLLDAINYALTGGEVDDALAADGVGDGATLSGVLSLRFDGDGIFAEDVEIALSIGLLEELAAFGGRRNWIENAGIGDARFGVVRNELVSVGCDPDSWITSGFRHCVPSVVATPSRGPR